MAELVLSKIAFFFCFFPLQETPILVPNGEAQRSGNHNSAYSHSEDSLSARYNISLTPQSYADEATSSYNASVTMQTFPNNNDGYEIGSKGSSMDIGSGFELFLFMCSFLFMSMHAKHSEKWCADYKVKKNWMNEATPFCFNLSLHTYANFLINNKYC